jgi:hypothetical protein
VLAGTELAKSPTGLLVSGDVGGGVLRGADARLGESTELGVARDLILAPETSGTVNWDVGGAELAFVPLTAFAIPPKKSLTGFDADVPAKRDIQ